MVGKPVDARLSNDSLRSDSGSEVIEGVAAARFIWQVDVRFAFPVLVLFLSSRRRSEFRWNQHVGLRVSSRVDGAHLDRPDNVSVEFVE